MFEQPPELSPVSRWVAGVIGSVARWSPRRAWIASVAAAAGSVLSDYATGAGVNVGILYYAATALTVWCLGQRVGILLGMIGIAAAWLLRYRGLIPSEDHRIAAAIWNVSARGAMILFVAVVVSSLRNALALERWRASTDGLTGILNKAAFQQGALQAVHRARLQDRALVLAYMDLDGFKDVNDRHGHSAGDRVLCAFAAAGSQVLREADLFARIGGDEFVALLTVRTVEDGDRVAAMLHDRLTSRLRETGFDVTCSMGALVSQARELDVEGTGGGLELADALMYEVKRAGKNALRIARGAKFGTTFRAAYPPITDDTLDDLLTKVDSGPCPVRSRKAA